jgi:predicted HAD superfamily Cof-like phosphohydrolase
MSIDWFADLLEFHKAMDCYMGTTPKEPPVDVISLRNKLEIEEYGELIRAANIDHNLPETADAIVDLIYVLIGRAVAYGIDLRPLWDEVHRSNMAKAPRILRADGKVLKPPGWTPPDVAGLLAKQKSIQ